MNVDHAATVLDAWADAIRGDWRDIDGRSCKAQLQEISMYLRGEQDELSFPDVGVCVKGGSPHWADGYSWFHEGEECNW